MLIKTFATFNTSGIAASAKRTSLDTWCYDNNIHICALQESNLRECRYTLTYGNIVGIPPISQHAGLAFWFDRNLPVTDVRLECIVADVILELSFWLNKSFYVFFNIHLPHRDADATNALTLWIRRLEFWKIPVYTIQKSTTYKSLHLLDLKLDQSINNHVQNGSVDMENIFPTFDPTFLVLGDFNLELERTENRTIQWKKVAVREQLNAILLPLEIQFLPMSFANKPLPGTRGPSVIDYVCIPSTWYLKLHSMEVIPTTTSDHSLVLARIKTDNLPIKSAFWRFKNELLENITFVSSMDSFLQELIKQAPDDPSDYIVWWNTLKEKIVEASKLCWHKNFNEREKIKMITTTKGTNPSQKKNVILPSTINFLRGSNGKITTNQEHILDTLVDFYSNLYSPTAKIINPDKKMTFGMNTIDSDLVKNLEEPVTLNDLYQAANSLNRNNAPGIDGIPLEFYLVFWPYMGPCLLRWFQYTIVKGRLSGSAGQGVLSLIAKKGDPRSITNWRPISLLTVDLKIVSKALTNKLTPAIVSVTKHLQMATPGNSIFSALSIIRDVIALHKSSPLPLGILALDQAKAFDRVDHNFIFHLLEVIGIPERMVASVKAIYTGYTCVIKNQGSLSKSFDYRRGVRQGDSMSTILYSLALQPALNALHLALYNEGFNLTSGDRVLLTAYADDVSIFLHNPRSIKTVINTLNQVANYSDASLNIDKCRVLAVNISDSDKENIISHSAPLGVTFTSLEILGIEFSSSLKITPKQWDFKITSTKKKLAKSFQLLKGMSLHQRAQWSKCKLWPSWSYLLKILHPTKEQLRQLSFLFSESLWLGGRHWLSQKDLASELSQGGLEALLPEEMIDILRISTIIKLNRMESSSIPLQLAQEILDKYADLGLGLSIFHTKPEIDHLSSLPTFYATILKAWDKLPICTFPQNKDEIFDLPTISSRFLLQLEEPIKIGANLAKSMGVRTIRDLYNYTPSRTRLSNNLVISVKRVLDSWILPPWPNDQNIMENKLAVNTEKELSCFFLQMPNDILHINNWNNAIICNIFKKIHTIPKSSQVPNKTWKILKSVEAPTSFINQMWKFLHTCTPTPSFYVHIGIRTTKTCILCEDKDFSYDHQYRTCPVLSTTINTLSSFVFRLGLEPLKDQRQLYTSQSSTHKLANFLILTYIYTVTLVIRSVANSNTMISKEKLSTIFEATITKHLKYHASIFPPTNADLRDKWNTYTCDGVIAYFKKDKLYILDKGIYRPFIE